MRADRVGMTTEQRKAPRPRGEGGVSWDESRQRYVASKTVGYDARGKRIVRRGIGKTESAALRNLRERVRQYEAGLIVGADRYTVAQAVSDWLEFGQTGEAEKTRQENRDLHRLHIEPHLGGRRLKDLRAEEVDRWLQRLTPSLSTSRLKQLHSALSRSVKRAVARGYAERNVVDLCRVPKGRPGRRSKSLSPEQADAVLALTTSHRMHSYIVVSMLTGLRTEEVRALRWANVHLDGDDTMPPHVEVWRSARVGGDTKTRTSRRTLALPARVVGVLVEQRIWQDGQRAKAGERWQDNGLVFTTRYGTGLSAANVRRDFRLALAVVPGLVPAEWTPRELRHSFVSLLSASNVPLEEISRLVGHSNTAVTELVYRHELRPVIQTGAQAMDARFGVGSVPTEPQVSER